MPRYNVQLEHELDGDIEPQTWSGEASSQDHAAELAEEAHPGFSAFDVEEEG